MALPSSISPITTSTSLAIRSRSIAEIGLEELQGHLHSLPDEPDAIPYVTSYYKAPLGLLPDAPAARAAETRHLPRGDRLYARTGPADLWRGGVAGGRASRKSSCRPMSVTPRWPTTSCPARRLTTWLARWLASAPRRYTYRLVFIPETIGSIVYLSRNLERLKERVIAGYNITCAGDERTYSFLPSRAGDTLADRGGPSRAVAPGRRVRCLFVSRAWQRRAAILRAPGSTSRWRASCARNTAPTLNITLRSTIWELVTARGSRRCLWRASRPASS